MELKDYKIGDKVILTNDYEDLEVGKIYSIKGFYSYSESEEPEDRRYALVGPRGTWMSANELKLAEEMGKLTIFEGLDACGKDTQADLYVERLDYVKARLPEYSNKTGQLLEEMKNNSKEGASEEFFQATMLANYIETYDNDILPLLRSGKNVVMTRAYDSMKAYSTHFGADSTTIDMYIRAFKAYLESKGVTYRSVFIDIPVDVALDRIQKRAGEQPVEEVFENEKTLTDVRETFQAIYGDNKIDGENTIESVYAESLVIR